MPADGRWNQSCLWENSRCIVTMRHCVHCAIGKKGKGNLHIACFHELWELKPTFWCLIFCSLLDTFELVSGDCDVRTLKLNYFYWTKVGIKSNPIKGLGRLWGFQEAEAPRFRDIRHMKVVRLSALRTDRLYTQEIFLDSFLLEAETTSEP